MLDGCARLDGLDLEGGADVGERGGTEGQRLGVVLLPSLVLGAEVEGARMLEVGGEDNGLVPGFSGELDTQVPSVEGDEDEVEVLRVEMLGGEGVKAIDSVPEGTSVTNVLPSQGCQACYWTQSGQRCVVGAERGRGRRAKLELSAEANLLHRGVMGVLTGLTRTLSWCNCAREPW